MDLCKRFHYKLYPNISFDFLDKPVNFSLIRFGLRTKILIGLIVLLGGPFLHAQDVSSNASNREHDLPFSRVHVAILGEGINKNALEHRKAVTSHIQSSVSFIDESSKSEQREGKTGTNEAKAAEMITRNGRKQIHLHDLRVVSGTGNVHTSDLIDGLEWIGQRNRTPNNAPVHVAYLNVAFSLMDENKRAVLRKSIRRLRDQGTVVIVPAGDQGKRFKNDQSSIVPASFPETISISALRGNGKTDSAEIAPYSNRGELVDFGYRVKPENQSTSYSAAAGTFAAAHILADLFQRSGPKKDVFKLYNPRDIRRLLFTHIRN